MRRATSGVTLVKKTINFGSATLAFGEMTDEIATDVFDCDVRDEVIVIKTTTLPGLLIQAWVDFKNEVLVRGVCMAAAGVSFGGEGQPDYTCQIEIAPQVP